MKRATKYAVIVILLYVYFNPRPREEGDRRICKTAFGLLIISIHALVKRATIIKMAKVFYSVISIHALVKRATLLVLPMTL